jgi:hypothetical protein
MTKSFKKFRESTSAYKKSLAKIADKKKKAGMSSSDQNKMGKLAALMKKQKREDVEYVDEGVGGYSLKRGKTSVIKGKGDGDDISITQYDILLKGKKVGEIKHNNYYGNIDGKLNGKELPDLEKYGKNTSGALGALHGFLKTSQGKKFVSESVEQIDEGVSSNLKKFKKTVVQKKKDYKYDKKNAAYLKRSRARDQKEIDLVVKGDSRSKNGKSDNPHKAAHIKRALARADSRIKNWKLPRLPEEVELDENRLLKVNKLSSVEYQRVKKLKGFDKSKYTWDSKQQLYIKEEVEQVDELKTSTVKSYVTKATKDRNVNNAHGMSHADSSQTFHNFGNGKKSDSELKKANKRFAKADKRQSGLDRAKKRYNEDVEQVDEVNVNGLSPEAAARKKARDAHMKGNVRWGDKDSKKVKQEEVEQVDEARAPSTVKYKGKTYYQTGKKGKDMKTGHPSFEYSSDMDGDDERLWYNTRTKKLKVESFENVDEALSHAQRIKASLRMKKMKSRIKIGRERAMRKTPNMDVVKKRAFRQARLAVLKKMTKGMDKSDVSFAKRQDLEKRLDKKRPLIQRLAKRLIPNVRKADRARRASKGEK